MGGMDKQLEMTTLNHSASGEMSTSLEDTSHAQLNTAGNNSQSLVEGTVGGGGGSEQQPLVRLKKASGRPALREIVREAAYDENGGNPGLFCCAPSAMIGEIEECVYSQKCGMRRLPIIAYYNDAFEM